MEMPHTSAFDDSPISTRFIRNCDEIGLFNDLQHNPFDETFKIAIKSHSNDETNLLKEPLWNQTSEETLNTPQIISSTKTEEPQNIFEEEDDGFMLSESFLVESVLPDNSIPCENEDDVSNESSDVEIIEEPVSNGLAEESLEEGNVLGSSTNYSMSNNILYLTGNTASKIKNIGKTFIIRNSSVYSTSDAANCKQFIVQKADVDDNNKRKEHLFLVSANCASQGTATNKSDFSQSKTVSRFPAILGGRNVIILPSESNPSKALETPIRNISPKTNPIIVKKNSEIDVKQRLKTIIKNSSSQIAGERPIVVESHRNRKCDSNSWTIEDKKEYSRERNRMAQKRCRLKKKRYVMQLKKETEGVVSENRSLHAEIDTLKAEIAHLKTLLLAHRNCSVTKAMFKADLAAILSNNISEIAEDIEIHLSDNTGDNVEISNIKNVINHHQVNQVHQQVNHIHLHSMLPSQQKIEHAIEFLHKNPVELKLLKPQQNLELQPTSQPLKLSEITNSNTVVAKKLIFDSKVVRMKPGDRLSHNVLKKNPSMNRIFL